MPRKGQRSKKNAKCTHTAAGRALQPRQFVLVEDVRHTALLSDIKPRHYMRLARFDDNRLGLVDGQAGDQYVRDVTAALAV